MTSTAIYTRSQSPTLTGKDSPSHPSLHNGVSNTAFRSPLPSSSSASLKSASSRLSSPTHHEVHILKVTGDTVEVEAGPFVRTATGSVREAGCLAQGRVGPPPPSPPASVEEITYASKAEELADLRDGMTSNSARMSISLSAESPLVASTTSKNARDSAELKPSQPDPVIFDEPEAIQDTVSIPRGIPQASAAPHARSLPEASSLRPITPQPTDFLQPPPMSLHKPRTIRRNTTDAGPANSRPPTVSHAQYSSQPMGDMDDDIDPDIQLEADKIRRERIEKRAKAELEKGKEKVDDMPLVGNLIGEDHVNYVLMYNMLTGIRTGVSRCQAKIKRPLTDEDFMAKHKFSFDFFGSELSPSVKYDFKFKDYAPWVFRSLREDYFHLDPADYLLSLTSKYILSELGSPGKSGSFFYFSRDYRFIIKTIHHSEHKFLLSVLNDYYQHVKNNPHTLLSRFYGLHRVKLPRGRKIHFVIMNNLFPPHKDIHETYDLKGSTVGREYPEDKIEGKTNPVLKDLNWINRDRRLELGPEKRALLEEQLRRDKEFLKKIHVMDYSLLVGIHNMKRGNKDNLRRNTLKVFQPDLAVTTSARRPTRSLTQRASRTGKSPMRRALRESSLGEKGDVSLPETLDQTEERQHFIFYQDEGGLRATDENNRGLDKIYYLGVIDILTPYTSKKKVEHLWKGLSADRHKISPVPPAEYAERFFSFMRSIMPGGDGGASFK